MELRQLRQFVVLADTLNFHRAAERLHMAQPPLSTAIRKLEEELGVALFLRDPRKLTLTDTGRILLQHAQRVLSDVDEFRRSATECATGEQGRLVLGFGGTASYTILPKLIPPFQALYPRVQLVLHESTSHELLRELADRTVDVALLRTPLFEECPAELLTLEHDRLALAVHPANPLARLESVLLRNLADQPLILSSREKAPAMHALVTLAFAQAGITPNVVQEFVQVSTAMALVESGLGAAVVPSATARYTLNRVKLLPIAGLPASMDIALALAHEKDTASGLVRRFVEVARAVFCAPQPPRAE